MSTRRRSQEPARVAGRQHFARELDRALALVIETRADDDLKAFVSALVAVRNARMLVAGLAVELGAGGGAT